MVQESTMICVDNSEWMRNGDFIPTRLQAQQDAANLVLQCKLRSNPENAVGILAMADKVEVLATMTQENNK
uniref:VWFA domain-containing protein n=1 Tax=Plectus sambesii TaxID=2011161 RepID=A0A914VHE6_9BILA